MRPHGASPGPVPDRFVRRRWGARLHRWRWSLVTGLVLALGAVAVWAVLGSTLLALHQVKVTGAGASQVARVGPAQVRHVIGVQEGTPLARVDLDEVESRVERLPGVASATASRDWPSSLWVDVIEREPVAVIDVDGTWQAVDATGTVFGAYDQAPAGMPELLPGEVDPAQLRSTLAEAGSVLGALEPSLSARVDSVEMTSPDDIELVLTSGERVRWGNAQDSARKAEVLMVLLRIPAAVYDVTVPELPTTSQTAQ